jgi:hypothetical protein
MPPKHLAANTLTLHTSSTAAQKPTRSPLHRYKLKMSRHKQQLKEGRDADGVVVAHLTTRLGFHPKT